MLSLVEELVVGGCLELDAKSAARPERSPPARRLTRSGRHHTNRTRPPRAPARLRRPTSARRCPAAAGSLPRTDTIRPSSTSLRLRDRPRADALVRPSRPQRRESQPSDDFPNPKPSSARVSGPPSCPTSLSPPTPRKRSPRQRFGARPTPYTIALREGMSTLDVVFVMDAPPSRPHQNRSDTRRCDADTALVSSVHPSSDLEPLTCLNYSS